MSIERIKFLRSMRGLLGRIVASLHGITKSWLCAQKILCKRILQSLVSWPFREQCVLCNKSGTDHVNLALTDFETTSKMGYLICLCELAFSWQYAKCRLLHLSEPLWLRQMESWALLMQSYRASGPASKTSTRELLYWKLSSQRCAFCH